VTTPYRTPQEPEPYSAEILPEPYSADPFEAEPVRTPSGLRYVALGLASGFIFGGCASGCGMSPVSVIVLGIVSSFVLVRVFA
jgi:hypothetical protein